VNSRPETVTAFIVGLSDEGQAMGLIRELRSSYSDALAVAASNASSAEIILASMRAGASEFLFTPFDVADLCETFEKHKRATGVAAATNVNGRLMCVLPAQGGNGASTLAVHLATAVNKLSKQKVLLIDYDFHCRTVAFRMRLKPDFSFADALDRISDIDELWGRLTSSRGGGVDILPAPPPGTNISGEAMRNVSAIFTSAIRSYPYVFVDFPSALHASCRDVLGLASSIYLISTPEVVSLHLARRRVNELLNLGVSQKNIHFVLNRVGSKKTLNVEDVAEVVGIPVFSSLPNDYAAVSDASLKGGLVPDDTRLGQQIASLGGKVADIDEDTAGKKKTGRTGKWKSLLDF